MRLVAFFLNLFFEMVKTNNKQLIFSNKETEAVLERLSSQVLELFHFNKNLRVIAVQPRGSDLATNICERIFKRKNIKIELGKIDPTFFRDDINTREGLLYPNENYIQFEITNNPVLLIDDVIFTGRTIRAAIEATLSLGRPEWIKLMVLVNRHLDREIPIAVDFEGIKADLDPLHKIKIDFSNSGNCDIRINK